MRDCYNFPTNFRRYYIPGSAVFITQVVQDRKPVFHDLKNRGLLWEILHNVQELHPFTMLGYVFLVEHFHMIIQSTGKSNFSDIMHSLKTNSTKEYKRRLGLPPSQSLKFRQKRFWDRAIRDDRDLLAYFTILDKVKYCDYDGFMKRNQELIDKIRSFNRFYTNILGLLDQHFLDSPFSLTEGRVLYEICNAEDCSAKKIRESIVIDEGYLSRILDNFAKHRLIKKTPSPRDRRLRIIVPTKKGKREFAQLNSNSNRLISQLIAKLSEEERADLLRKMDGIRVLLEKAK